MTSRVRTNSHKAGFTLIEMLGVVSIIGLFIVLESKLFVASLHVMRDAGTADVALFQWQDCMRHMRDDIWGSTALRVEQPQMAELHQADGSTVVWRSDPARKLVERTILRDGQGTDRRYWPMPVEMTFTRDGPALLVHTTGAASQRNDTRKLVSQVMLLRGDTQ